MASSIFRIFSGHQDARVPGDEPSDLSQFYAVHDDTHYTFRANGNHMSPTLAYYRFPRIQ